MPTISLTGTLNVQLTNEARPQPVPIAFSTQYSKKALVDFDFTVAQSNTPISQPGTVDAPRLIFVQVIEGEVNLSWSPSGDSPTTIRANPSPPPNEPPMMLLYSYAPESGQIFLSTPGPARGRIWLFE